MIKSKHADRIKKLEETGELMDHMLAIPKVNGQDLAMEECAAIDLGVRTGFTAAATVAEGKCDDMEPMEIAARMFETASGTYIESVVLSDEYAEDVKYDLEVAESEAKHAED